MLSAESRRSANRLEKCLLIQLSINGERSYVGCVRIRNDKFKRKEIDFLLNLSASPFTFDKLDNRTKVSTYAAKDLQIPLIYINQVGGNDYPTFSI